MLDLFISFLTLLITSIRKLVFKFVFYPPKPEGYRECEDGGYELLRYYPKGEYKYTPLRKLRNMNIDYIKIPDPINDSFIPIFKIYPDNYNNICIIYSHGNSSDIGTSIIPEYDLALNTYCCVVAYDYPQYGTCVNLPLTEENVYYNLRKTYEYVRDVLQFDTKNIILYGFSLGTGVSFELATQENCPIGGLILQSPFLSIIRTRYNFKKTAFYDCFNSVDKCQKLKCKVLLVHGNKDTIVPYIHGKILAKLIPPEYLYEFVVCPGAAHNNLLKLQKDLVYAKTRKFLTDCTGIKFNDEESTQNERDKNTIAISKSQDINSHIKLDSLNPQKKVNNHFINYINNNINNNINSNTNNNNNINLNSLNSNSSNSSTNNKNTNSNLNSIGMEKEKNIINSDYINDIIDANYPIKEDDVKNSNKINNEDINIAISDDQNQNQISLNREDDCHKTLNGYKKIDQQYLNKDTSVEIKYSKNFSENENITNKINDNS